MTVTIEPPVRHTFDHMLALDMALAMGITVPLNGSEYTFSPLSYRDLAELAAAFRSSAVANYQNGTAKATVPVDFRQRLADLNAILYSVAPTNVQVLLSSPEFTYRVLDLSLRQKHPDITDDEVAAFVDSDEGAQAVMAVIISLSVGPRSPDEIMDEKGNDGSENPMRH